MTKLWRGPSYSTLQIFGMFKIINFPWKHCQCLVFDFFCLSIGLLLLPTPGFSWYRQRPAALSQQQSLCACLPCINKPHSNLVTLYRQESQRIKWINTWNLSEWRTFGGFTIGRHIKGVYEVILVLIWGDQYTLPPSLSVDLTIPHQLVILLTQRRHKERRGRGRIVGNRTVLIIFGAYFHLEVLSSERNI